MIDKYVKFMYNHHYDIFLQKADDLLAASTDMTVGSESGNIIRFTLPLLAGNLLQQTYNIVDTIIVGKFLGSDSLAAVGATGSLTFLFYTLCNGLSVGSGIIIAQLFGAGMMKKMRSSIFNSAAVTAAFGILISVISIFLASPVLRAMKVPDELIGTSTIYMQIACGGTIAVAAYNWINAVMRGLGDSKTPLMFLMVSTVLNVGMDLLFVVGFKMGVAGAAWATVMAQGLAALSCIIYCFRKNPDIHLTKEDMRFDRRDMLRCISTGVPIAAQSGLIAVSMAALQRVTNGFGEDVMASYTVSMRIEQFVQQPFASLNAAVSTFTGQNIGAGREDRARKGLAVSLKIETIFAFIMLALFMLTANLIVGCFVDKPEVISMGGTALRITAVMYWALGMIHVTRGFLNGAGDTVYALINGATEVVCRITFSIILTRISFIGFWGIWITTALTWMVTGLVSLMRYKSDKWKNRSVASAK